MARRLRSMLDEELDDLDRTVDAQLDDLCSVSPLAHALEDATSVEQPTSPADRQLAEYRAAREARDLPVYPAGERQNNTSTSTKGARR